MDTDTLSKWICGSKFYICEEAQGTIVHYGKLFYRSLSLVTILYTHTHIYHNYAHQRKVAQMTGVALSSHFLHDILLSVHYL